MTPRKISDLKANVKNPKKNIRKPNKKTRKKENKKTKDTKKPETSLVVVKQPVDSVKDHELAVDLISGIFYSSYKDPKSGEPYDGVVDGVVRGAPEALKGGAQPGNNNALKWTEEVAMALAADMLEWLNEKDSNIFFNRFLVQFKNVHPQVISQLTKKYPSFRKVMDMAKEIKRLKLWAGATSGKLHAGMTKFALANHHGEVEKLETTIMNPDGSPILNTLQIEFVKPKKHGKNKKKEGGKKK